VKRRVVVDANRIFSELISPRGRFLRPSSVDEVELACPKYVMVELFKHKERIAEASGLDADSLLELLRTVLEQITFHDEESISIGSWAEAWRLCREVDEDDIAYVALTLEIDGELWTGDQELETGLRKKGFARFFKPG
jgi:predicted nucleic acid-binding protein